MKHIERLNQKYFNFVLHRTSFWRNLHFYASIGRKFEKFFLKKFQIQRIWDVKFNTNVGCWISCKVHIHVI